MAIELVRKVASATRGGEFGNDLASTQTFSGPKTWNDVQTWKASVGALSVGSYDASGNFTIGPSGGSTNLTHLVTAGSGTVELKIFSANTGASATTLSIRNSSGTAANDGLKIVHGAGVTKFTDLSGLQNAQIDLTGGGAWTFASSVNAQGGIGPRNVISTALANGATADYDLTSEPNLGQWLAYGFTNQTNASALAFVNKRSTGNSPGVTSILASGLTLSLSGTNLRVTNSTGATVSVSVNLVRLI